MVQGSEVARLRQQLADEYQASKRGLAGLAYGTSMHSFITRHMENMQRCQEQIEILVGHERAKQIFIETLDPL